MQPKRALTALVAAIERNRVAQLRLLTAVKHGRPASQDEADEASSAKLEYDLALAGAYAALGRKNPMAAT